jgi:S-adenosylmethionine:tRNA ribosyltransferase-isomerase
MKTSDFNFELPPELIAQHPPAQRGQSRLLVMDRKTRSLEHRMVRELPAILPRETLMVFNNSRVRKARISGLSEASGAKVEFLLLDEECGFPRTGQFWRAIVQRARRRRPGSRYLFPDSSSVLGAEIVAEGEAGFEMIRILKFDRPIDDSWLELNGHVPLPPYIKRKESSRFEADSGDSERYQTVYAGEYGSAAAPTAGLHFTHELLDELEKTGIETAFITLHVGLGTFLPVKTESVEDHLMHEENYSIDDETAGRIEKAIARGSRILAVGTTSVRTLESASAEGGRIKRGGGRTSIFIYPPYRFKTVNALFTNFHTPESTLLMLVSAFADRDFILKAYKEAVKEGYRFFSYGDACLIL